MEPFHGLVEVIQNADDQRAREVRIALEVTDNGTNLLVAHDGKRVGLRNVVAMSLAFVSTKREDAEATGRFGIGLKTLRQIGTDLSVHGHPYHFAAEPTGPVGVAPVRDIRGLYSVASDTLIRLRLKRDIDASALFRWFEGWSVERLVFLRSVRQVSFGETGPNGYSASARRNLVEHRRVTVPLQVGADVVDCNVADIAEEAGKGTWRVVSARLPVSSDVARAYKATEPTALLGIALPHRAGDGLIFAGLPLAVPVALPFHLNGPFDPDTSRGGLLHTTWNAWLLRGLGDSRRRQSWRSSTGTSRKPGNGSRCQASIA